MCVCMHERRKVRIFGMMLTSQIMNYHLLSTEEEECLIFVASVSRNQISLQIILECLLINFSW